jgi:tRNA pseudouridine55 synthase
VNEATGIVLLDKPANLTSFQTLGPVKKALKTRKVGHAGTLDRFATGLLILFSGNYTRLVPFFSGCDKVYRAGIAFGVETDTLDPEGLVVRTAPIPGRDALESVLPSFMGTILQAPPEYSAVHLDGKRAYERALAGEKPEMKPRPVRIEGLELESYESGKAVLLVRCGSGTYIRSLARDIACACGSCAHLEKLARLSIGPFTLDMAVSPERFDPLRDLSSFTPDMAASIGLPVRSLDDSYSGSFLNGAKLRSSIFGMPAESLRDASPAKSSTKPEPSAIFSGDSTFLGMAELGGEYASYRFVLGGKA